MKSTKQALAARKDKMQARKVSALALHKTGRSVDYIATFLGVTQRQVYRYLGDSRRDARADNSGRPRKYPPRCPSCGGRARTEYPIVDGTCTRKRCQKQQRGHDVKFYPRKD